jgi:cytochrome d ubiquinol oxidase subunit II
MKPRVVLLAYYEANWFFERLLSDRSLLVIALELVCFAGSAWSVFSRRYVLSRLFAAAEIALLILGWGLAQHPYLVYPDITFVAVAAPQATLRFLVLSLPVGAALILPSLWFLFRVFKNVDSTGGGGHPSKMNHRAAKRVIFVSAGEGLSKGR